jgi:hypothetical protein
LSQEQEGSDGAALIANERVYLRLYKSEFEKKPGLRISPKAHFLWKRVSSIWLTLKSQCAAQWGTEVA